MNHFDCAVRGASYFAGPYSIDHAHGYSSDPYRSQHRHSNCPRSRCVSVGLVRSICCATNLSAQARSILAPRLRSTAWQGSRGGRSGSLQDLIFECHAFRVIFLKPCFRGVRICKDLQVVGIADPFACVDVDEDCRCWSLLSFRRPQCISLRSVNVRWMLRFKARNTPMRACIIKSRASAAPNSGRSRFAIPQDPARPSAISCVVGGIAQGSAARAHPVAGSSKVRAQPTAGLDRAISYHVQGCAERSIGVLFRCFDCRTFWADCSAFLCRSRSSFNSEI
jgi:hypothetical protein